MAKSNQPIIIKKVKKAAHAHHGGAWKIAYADFVTAMMAFFLLMWLISMTTQEQKIGLAEYFTPEAMSLSNSGSGGILNGKSIDDSGSQASGSRPELIRRAPPVPLDTEKGTTGQQDGGEDGASESKAARPAVEAQAYLNAAVSIRQALQALPEVTPYISNLLIEVTEEGVDILIVDQDGRRMFAQGSKEPMAPTRAMIAAIAPILQRLEAQVTISGHAAAGGRYADRSYGPWELTADRANIVRAILSESGLSDGRISSVIGRATTDPYFHDDPYMAANERVRVSVVFEPPPIPADWKP